jgi:hypothetical protein
MESNLNKIAMDLYGKIQTRFPSIQIGDQDANVLSKKKDVPQARFFEFEYEENGEDIGTITMTLDADEGLVVEISGDIIDKKHPGAIKFIRSFRPFAKDRLLNFKLQRMGKSNLDKRDYAFRSQVKDNMIMENKLYGTSKMSYQDLGEARLIIKHSEHINPDLPAGRTMHIESIYIENALGERFRYPAKHLNGARALAEHIKHGGHPYDGIGQHITGLSEELASLRKFKNYVSRQEQLSEAMGDITTKVMERIESIKKQIHGLQRPAYYEQFAESFEAHEEQMIPEELMDNWIDRLTIRTFNEELKSVFPYIYKLVDESEVPVKELSADDLLGESPADSTPHVPKDYQTKEPLKKGPDGKWRNSKGEERDSLHGGPLTQGGTAMHRGLKLGKPTQESIEDQFENFMNGIVDEAEGNSGVLDKRPQVQKQAIDQLNQIFQTELKAGVDGVNFDKVKELIPDPQFAQQLDALQDPGLDARLAIKAILDDIANSNRDIANLMQSDEIVFGGGEEEVGGADMPDEPTEPEAPVEPTAAEPAAPVAPAAPTPPQQPMAEGDDEDPPFDGPYTKHKGDVTDKSGAKHTGRSQAKHLAKQGIKAAIMKAIKAGAKGDTELDFGHKKTTLMNAMQECGIDPASMGMAPQMNIKEELLKAISGFWNAEAKNFTIGGSKAKKKAKDAAEELIASGAPRDEVIHVLKHVVAGIEKMDPSSDVNQQGDIMRLAGVKQPLQADMEEGAAEDDFAELIKNFKTQHGDVDVNQLFQQLQQTGDQPNQAAQAPTSTQSSNQTGTVNGKPASYDDAMSKFRDIAGGMGFDGSSPEAMQKSIQGKLGGMMKGVMDKVPQGQQQIDMPGFNGSVDPQAMMKGIMGKMPGFQEGTDPELAAMLKIAGLRK